METPSTSVRATPDTPYAPPQSGAETANPYAAPQTNASLTPDRKAYSLGQIVCGTLFGSLFCTAVMLRNNYKAFDKDTQASKAFWLVSAIALILMMVAMILPGRLWGYGFTLVSLFVVSNWFSKHMQRDYNVYTRQQGRRCSNWRTFGVILLCLLTVVVIGVFLGFIRVAASRLGLLELQ